MIAGLALNSKTLKLEFPIARDYQKMYLLKVSPMAHIISLPTAESSNCRATKEFSDIQTFDSKAKFSSGKILKVLIAAY